MFKLKFGIIWTLFVTPIFILCLVVPGQQRGGVDMTPRLFAFFMLFEAIGVSLIVSGLKQLIVDKKTDKLGDITYGKIVSIYGTGTFCGGQQELKAEILAYLPSENRVRIFNEIIGFQSLDYNVDDFVLLKYYEGDVNIVQVISENSVPSAVLTLLQ